MSPFVVTTKRPIIAVSPFASRGSFERDSLPIISVLAVATLEERQVFDSKEWVAAGGDQPDGNGRFWHNALVLAREIGSGLTSDGSREKLLTVMFLHDGRRSAGHFEHMTRPAEPLIPESGGTVGTLPNGTLIQVEPVSIHWLGAECGFNRFYGDTDEQIIAALNAKQAGQ